MRLVSISNMIQISDNDKRLYKHIKLANDLDVILIEDSVTEKCAACLDVRVGSMSDPENVPGLAHFLEHMLFMGTEKYPVENAYSAFLNANGGGSNAYTAQQNTVYYFDVLNSAFEEALNLFSSFFTCPLFNADSTDREINAVDNENTKNLQSDSWRGYQLLKSLAQEGHQFNNFSTGNKETLKIKPESLGINIRELLLEWYAKHYSSNLMKVVIYGSQSLETLEKWAIEKFSHIPNRKVPDPVFAKDVFPENRLGKYLEVVPVKDAKTIEILVPLPPINPLYLTKPSSYISHLVGHESEGSILSALKAKGWANSLSAGAYQPCNEVTVLNVNIDVTDEGLAHKDDVISCVFAYFELLQSKAPEFWIMEESKLIDEMKFKFLDKRSPSGYATTIANNMQVYPIEHVVSGAHLIFKIDLPAVAAFIKLLQLERSIITVISKSFQGKTTLKEVWYGTDYSCSPFSNEQIALWRQKVGGSGDSAFNWNHSLHLPEKNLFVPSDFKIRYNNGSDSEIGGASRDQNTPFVLEYNATRSDDSECFQCQKDEITAEGEPQVESQIEEDESEDDGDDEGASSEVAVRPLDTDGVSAWFVQDKRWLVPKANIMIKIESSLASVSPRSIALTDVLSQILQERLSEFSYYADCAGLHYNVNLLATGLNLTFRGFSEKMSILIVKCIEELKHLPVKCTQELFQRIKEKSLREYKNFIFKPPYHLAMVGTLNCLETPRWTSSEKYFALEGVTLSGFVEFTCEFLSQLRTEVFIVGNYSEEEAKDICAAVNSSLAAKPLPVCMLPGRRMCVLSEGTTYINRQHTLRFNPEEKNSAIENMYFISPECNCNDADANASSLLDEAILKLLSDLISEPAFDQLRTKEQLGYIVHVSSGKVGQMLSLRVIIQSNSKDPVYLNQRIELFFENYRSALSGMSNESFQTHINAVIEKLVEKPKNLTQEAEAWFDECTNAMYLYKRKSVLAELLKTVTLEKVVAFFDRYIKSDRRIKFSSQFFGKGTSYPVQIDKTYDSICVLVKDPTFFKRSCSLSPIKTAVLSNK